MRSIVLALSLVGLFGFATPALAYEIPCTVENNSDCQIIRQDGLSDGTGQVSNIINVSMMLLGAIAVIVIIYGGFLYVTSRGDAGKVTAAKNTILYAVIGIIVALLAYAIVRFVVDRFGATSTTSNTTNTSTTQ